MSDAKMLKRAGWKAITVMTNWTHDKRWLDPQTRDLLILTEAVRVQRARNLEQAHSHLETCPNAEHRP